MEIGPKVRPITAAMAPRAPAKRDPTHTARLTIFGPGTIWHIPRIALNSSEVKTLSLSTRVRLAQGKTPPKPDMPILLKLIKSSSGVNFFKMLKA